MTDSLVIVTAPRGWPTDGPRCVVELLPDAIRMARCADYVESELIRLDWSRGRYVVPGEIRQFPKGT